jgi:hypothetical protein
MLSRAAPWLVYSGSATMDGLFGAASGASHQELGRCPTPTCFPGKVALPGGRMWPKSATKRNLPRASVPDRAKGRT